MKCERCSQPTRGPNHTWCPPCSRMVDRQLMRWLETGDDLPMQEIAAELGMTRGAAYQRVSRLRRAGVAHV